MLGIDLQIFYDYKIIQFYYDSQFDCGRKSEYLGKNTDILYICMTLTNFINFDGIKYTLTRASVKPTNRSGNVYHLSNENHPTPFLTRSQWLIHFQKGGKELPSFTLDL